MESTGKAEMSTVAGFSNDQIQTYNPLLEFKAGVTACLLSWSALRTAVESGWGGGELESHKKAEDLRNHIFEKMDGRKCPLPNYDAFDLADDLAIYIEEEFSVTVEDDSERQLAGAIFQIYEQCLNGDPTFARQIVAQAASAVALIGQFPVKVQTTEHDDEDDEMELTDSSTTVNTTNNLVEMQSPSQRLDHHGIVPFNLQDYVSQPLFGKAKLKKAGATKPTRQLGQVVSESGDVEMDEDGFVPAKKGNRRR